MKTNPLCVDLSHWDPATSYPKLKTAGIPAVIYKATQGQSYCDPTYKEQRRMARDAGMLWGAYHFADGTSPQGQADHFLLFAEIGPADLFCLDFEDNQNSSMSIDGAHQFIDCVESALNRPGELVFYSGNRVKDLLGNKKDAYLGTLRLWLAQYGSNPVCQCSWSSWWLWQYTDGQYGPGPYTFPGLDQSGVDCNSFEGSAHQLAAQWASGSLAPAPEPPDIIATITVIAPAGVQIKVVQQ